MRYPAIQFSSSTCVLLSLIKRTQGAPSNPLPRSLLPLCTRVHPTNPIWELLQLQLIMYLFVWLDKLENNDPAPKLSSFFFCFFGRGFHYRPSSAAPPPQKHGPASRRPRSSAQLLAPFGRAACKRTMPSGHIASMAWWPPVARSGGALRWRARASRAAQASVFASVRPASLTTALPMQPVPGGSAEAGA
jgi:hypothetical protein